MKWCQPHWDQLRQAITDKGLMPFVARNGEEAAANVATELSGGDAPFDPLMGSWARINSQMLDDVGLAAMGQCPLCILVEDGRPDLVANWVDGVTDGALAYAREQGLIKTN